jgi:hypothetical protein
MKINVLFWKFLFSFLREHDDYKLFFFLNNFSFLRMIKNVLSQNTTCCENVNNVFCYVLFRNVKCDRKMRFQIFFFAESISVNSFRDHAWSFHRLCFNCSTRIFLRWQTKFNSIFRNERNLTKRLIKLDESDSLNLTKTIHQTWRMILHQTWRMIFHQTWRMISH